MYRLIDIYCKKSGYGCVRIIVYKLIEKKILQWLCYKQFRVSNKVCKVMQHTEGRCTFMPAVVVKVAFIRVIQKTKKKKENRDRKRKKVGQFLGQFVALAYGIGRSARQTS